MTNFSVTMVHYDFAASVNFLRAMMYPFLLGVMVACTPSLVVIAWIAWRAPLLDSEDERGANGPLPDGGVARRQRSRSRSVPHTVP